MTYSIQFIKADGTPAFSKTFEADTDERAKGTAAIALDGYQTLNKDRGSANLFRIEPTGTFRLGTMDAGFNFIEADAA